MQRFCRFHGPASACLAIAVITVVLPQRTAIADPVTPRGAALKSVVERLIVNLDSKSRRVRVAAEARLIQLGPRVLPLLPPPELTPNIAVREAVRRVRLRLETTAARDSVKPSTVTLSGSKKLSDILHSISKQTENRFDLSKVANVSQAKPLSVNYRRSTFWEVINDLEIRGNLRFHVSPDANRMVVETRPKKRPPRLAVDNRSAYRMVVLSVQTKPIIGDTVNRLLRINWSMTAEPRLRPLFMKYTGRSLIVETAAGKRLAPFNPDASLEIPATDGAAAFRQRSDFVLPKGVDVRSIRLRGKIHILTAAGREPIEFRNLSRAGGREKRRGGVTVTVNRVGVLSRKKKGEPVGTKRITVDISVSYDTGGPAFESHRTWIFHNRVFLETSSGKRRLANAGFKTAVQQDGAIRVVYNFADPGEPPAKLKFVYVAPTLLINVPVEFDFRQVLLTPKKPSRRSR